jgi:hypothetical protein
VNVITDIAIPLVAGAGGGTFAALVTPWAQWGVDKRRQKHTDRASIISGARDLVAEQQEAGRSEILRDQRYLAIRPHLTPETEAKMRKQGIVAVSDPYGTAGNYFLGLIRDEADRLEREWDLR